MDGLKLQEGNRIDTTRRRVSAGLCLGLLTTLAGCGGSEEDLIAGTLTWEVVPSRALALAPGASFDLRTTLPASEAGGGVFDVDPSGSSLPAGVTLSPTGVLVVGPSASGSASGVVFRYTPPA